MAMAETILARPAGLGRVVPGRVATMKVETTVVLGIDFLPIFHREILKARDVERIAIYRNREEKPS